MLPHFTHHGIRGANRVNSRSYTDSEKEFVNTQARFATQTILNPWYKDAGIALLGYGFGVLNPMDNKVPFIPWL